MSGAIPPFVSLPHGAAGSSQRLTWNRFRAGVQDASSEPRWAMRVFSTSDGTPEQVSAVQVIKSRTWGGLDAVAQHTMKDMGLVPGPVGIVGACTRGIGGGYSALRAGSGSTLADDVSNATSWSRRDGMPAVALWVPESQLGWFTTKWGACAVTRHAGAYSWLELGDAGSLDEWVGRLPRRPRQTWRQDIRRSEERGFVTTCHRVTPALVDEAVPLVRAVNEKNGDNTHPRLLALRIQRWADAAEHALIFRTIDRHGDLVGVVTAELESGSLTLYDVGIGRDPRGRRELYAHCVFLAPAEWALSAGQIGSIALGPGHSAPKVIRGAEYTVLWNIVDTRNPLC